MNFTHSCFLFTNCKVNVVLFIVTYYIVVRYTSDRKSASSLMEMVFFQTNCNLSMNNVMCGSRIKNM